MRFGERVRALRTTKGLSQRGLCRLLGVSVAYVSKIESGKLAFGDYPSAELICRLAKALDADEDDLLVLAEKIPEPVRRRFLERPDAFRLLARLDDRRLDGVIAFVARRSPAAPKSAAAEGSPSSA